MSKSNKAFFTLFFNKEKKAVNKNIDIDSLSKDIVKRALDSAQADIDRHLTSIADDVLMKYYEDYEPTQYERTENFLEKCYYLRHHHNQGRGGGRQYRYINLWFSPDEMNEVYYTYRRKGTESFPKDQVFYQNFNHGYHGRIVGTRTKGDKYWIKGKTKYIPAKELEKEWNNLRKQDRSKFNKMMDEKIYAAFDDVIAEIDEKIVGIIDSHVKNGLQ